jgi:hypothetical protein
MVRASLLYFTFTMHGHMNVKKNVELTFVLNIFGVNQLQHEAHCKEQYIDERARRSEF